MGGGGRLSIYVRRSASQIRARQARALCACGGPEPLQGGRTGEQLGAQAASLACLRRLRGTPEQLCAFLRDRDGAPTVDDVAALLA